ncbi:hypothetical protein [Hymenobacter psoromatis]|uniref:hypothetical protein n=1 Tax=Hymenobacter psoromatis TaxID=1484116 RepID=UPI001CBAC676|nr:hypothetical protein [Hymenobacter psoromatis]
MPSPTPLPRQQAKFGPALQGKPLINLRIPDNYPFQNPALVALLRARLAGYQGPEWATIG